jgi:hypothetical protein
VLFEFCKQLVAPLAQYFIVLGEHQPPGQFLSAMSVTMAQSGEATHQHGKPIIRKYLGQIVEKVVVVFAQPECRFRDVGQPGFKRWRKLGLVLPRICITSVAAPTQVGTTHKT